MSSTETNPEHPTTSEHSRSSSLGMRTVVVLASAVATFGFGKPTAERDIPLPPRRVVEATSETLAEPRAVIAHLLSSPDDPILDTLSTRISELEKTKPGTSYGLLRVEAEYQIRKEIAERYRLTVFDPTPALAALYEDVFGLSAEPMPGEDFMAIVGEFLANYGVNLEVADPDQRYYFGLQPLSLDALTIVTKQRVFDIVQEIATHPLEEVRLARLQTIAFARRIDRPDNGTLLHGYADFSKRAIVLNLTDADSGTYHHELTHLVDEALLGKPSEYIRQSVPPQQQDIYVGNDWTKYIKPGDSPQTTLANFEIYFGGRYVLLLSTDENSCLSMTAKIAQVGSDVVLPEAYAGAGIGDHTAVIGEFVGSGNMADLINPYTPHIKEQLTRYLTVVYHADPRLARFYIDASRRQSHVPTPAEACTR